jgi:hypothetical protein
MKTRRFSTCGLALLAALTLSLPAKAGIDWRFPVGLSYASGMTDVVDAMDDNFNLSDDFVWPVGLSFQPYAEFDFGLGIGASVGPIAMVFIDDGWETDVSFMVPLGLDVRYTFFRKGNVSPYARAGFKYIVAGGDYLDSGDPGVFGAVGVEFLRKKRINWGLEVGYCAAEVEVAGGYYGGPKDVKPCEWLISVFAIF